MAVVPVTLSENEILSGKLTDASFEVMLNTGAAAEVVDSVGVVPAGVTVSEAAGVVIVRVEDGVVTATLAGGGAGGTGSVSGAFPQPAANARTSVMAIR